MKVSPLAASLALTLALVACRGRARTSEGPAANAPRASQPQTPAVPSARLAADGAGAPPAVPSPPPTGVNLDELMAVVEGESITRRSLVREIGERGPDQDEREYELHLHAALLRRATNRIFVKAGEREGLVVTPDRVDEYVKEQKRAEVDSARQQAEGIEKGSGAKITFERILKERSITMEEYRSEKAKELMRRQYFYVLWHGVPGKRAVVDLEASPEDVRRLYAAHRSELDERTGVRYAIFVLQPFDAPDAAKRSYDEVMADAKRSAEALLTDFRRDSDGERVAKAFGIKKGRWTEVPAGQFAEANEVRPKAAGDWLFSPGRHTGEWTVLLPPEGGVLAISLIELRPARTLSFEQVQDAILERIRQIRLIRFQEQHTLDLLAKAQIWPASLADDIVDRSRASLKRLDDDPVNRDIRLR